jgi:predicted AlkP superfamily phosphohydrolase/phosphomutase
MAGRARREVEEPAKMSNERSPKVLVIGLDGATLDLIGPWADDGKLPHLSRLMREGVSGGLRSTVPPVTGPAWTSFMTGKGPGKHGIYHFRTYDLTKYSCYDETLVTSRRFARDTIFKILSNAGRRVASLAVPMTFPPFEVNGVMLAGYPAPKKRAAYTYPPELADKFAHISFGSEYPCSLPERIVYATSMVQDLTASSLELMDEQSYDLLMVTFTNTDMANHFFRKYMDRDYVGYDPQGAEDYGNVLLEQYQLADEGVGRLVQRAGDDATVVIVSDHGSGVHATRYFHTNSWLGSKGWLQTKKGLSVSRARTARALLESIRMRAPKVRDVVKRTFPNSVKARISSGLQGASAIDWAETKAYRVPMFYFVEGIEINLKGRQPQGTVLPGQEYEELRSQIISELVAVRDPDTGKQVASKVMRREEEYSGPFASNAPDIVAFYDHDYAGGANPAGPLFGPVESYTLEEWSGLHRMNGTLILRGPHVRQGWQIQDAQITDVAPTILYLLGMPVPSDMDGRVLTAALDPALLKRRPIEHVDRVSGEGPPEPDDYLSEEEAEQIKEALRGLGYIE